MKNRYFLDLKNILGGREAGGEAGFFLSEAGTSVSKKFVEVTKFS